MIFKFTATNKNFNIYDNNNNVCFVGKIERETGFTGKIYDDLNVSELFSIAKVGEVFEVYAFGVSFAKIRKEENKYTSLGGNVHITFKEENKAFITVNDVNCTVVTEGQFVTLAVDDTAKAPAFLAIALLLFAEDQDQSIHSLISQEKIKIKEKPKTVIPKKENISKQKSTKKEAIKNKFLLILKAIGIITDRFFIAIGKGTRGAVKNLSQTKKVTGKTAFFVTVGIIISIIATVFCGFTAIIRQQTNLNFVKTSALAVPQGDTLVGEYQIDNITYTTTDVPKGIYDYYEYTVYYLLDDNGQVKICRTEKYSIAVWGVLSAFFAVTAVTLIVISRKGLPQFFNKK